MKQTPAVHHGQSTVEALPSLKYTEEQLSAFRENGYMKIPQAVPAPLLQQLREALERIRRARAESDTYVTAPDGKEYFVNAGNLCYRGESVFTELLGSPMLLSLAEAICGDDFFPIQEFSVIKNLGDESPVNWHQDVHNGSPGKTFMIGIYLDAADEENGALRVIPGSHRSAESICTLEKQPFVSISMEPGDILVHDLMIAHSSGVLKTNEQRRVIYFEFMSAMQACNETIYPEEFISIRTRLIPIAIRKYSEANPASESFLWKHPQKELYTVSDDLQNELDIIYRHRLRVKPANYCFDFLQKKDG